jgi:hypothetical protein
MDSDRQRLIQRARELNTSDLPVMELQERIREVCSEYLIEAKIDVDHLLRHEDWRVRSSALQMVWWGVGATDGTNQSIEILMHDSDEDIRAEAVLALYEAARSTPKEAQVSIQESRRRRRIRLRAGRRAQVLAKTRPFARFLVKSRCFNSYRQRTLHRPRAVRRTRTSLRSYASRPRTSWLAALQATR